MNISILSETQIESAGNICLLEMRNSKGTNVRLINWGASLVSIETIDNKGELSNILLGYSSPLEYIVDTYYMGATIGPFANRIRNALFSVDGKLFYLDRNEGVNINHSGKACVGRKCWNWEVIENSVCFSLLSPHLEGGFPGNLLLNIKYSLTDDDVLLIEYYGMTDAKTYVNLTNHAYFNLDDHTKRISEHWLQINADEILETDSTFIPTGRLVSVKNTPFDFSKGHLIGDYLYDLNNQQIVWNKGYNHYYVFRNVQASMSLLHAASLICPSNGRRVDIFTDYPGMLLYTAGYYCCPDTGVCFETQYYPDTPSHIHFPSCLLSPGEVYYHKTAFKFSID